MIYARTRPDTRPAAAMAVAAAPAVAVAGAVARPLGRLEEEARARACIRWFRLMALLALC